MTQVYPFSQVLERTGRLPGQKEQGFTTVGKAKMASKQYNSPMAMYSEDIIEEIMTQVTIYGLCIKSKSAPIRSV